MQSSMVLSRVSISSFLNICSSFTGTSAPRHFVIRHGTGIHLDTVFSIPLRSACGASSIRLPEKPQVMIKI